MPPRLKSYKLVKKVYKKILLRNIITIIFFYYKNWLNLTLYIADAEVKASWLMHLWTTPGHD